MSLPTSEARIVAESVDIDPGAVRDFFAGRAERADSDHPLTSVLYQDSHPELAEQRDGYERSFALPLLQLEQGNSVLDVACGIGRWAESVLPVTADYVGVDLTEELIAAARRRWAGTGARFETMAADEVSLDALGRERGFDRILVVGLLMYLNDSVATTALRALADAAAPTCRVWLREPMAVTCRLTLRDFWSTELEQSYSAVYRTPAEIDALLAPTLLAAGFAKVAEGDLYPDALNNRPETAQRYIVLERR